MWNLPSHKKFASAHPVSEKATAAVAFFQIVVPYFIIFYYCQKWGYSSHNEVFVVLVKSNFACPTGLWKFHRPMWQAKSVFTFHNNNRKTSFDPKSIVSGIWKYNFCQKPKSQNFLPENTNLKTFMNVNFIIKFCWTFLLAALHNSKNLTNLNFPLFYKGS